MKLLAPAGAGGMGEVYKARDTRLDRTVAIKVLPAACCRRSGSEAAVRARSQDAGRAQPPAHLPRVRRRSSGRHRLPGHGVPRRARRSRRGSLMVRFHSIRRSATRFRSPMRSTKPTAQGSSTGISSPATSCSRRRAPSCSTLVWRNRRGPALGTSGSRLPTTPSMTERGTILGTFQYMAPEQLEGTEADARTDIFAFGAVVYEMLTGKKAFEGRNPDQRDRRDHAGRTAADRREPAARAAAARSPREDLSRQRSEGAMAVGRGRDARTEMDCHIRSWRGCGSAGTASRGSAVGLSQGRAFWWR